MQLNNNQKEVEKAHIEKGHDQIGCKKWKITDRLKRDTVEKQRYEGWVKLVKSKSKGGKLKKVHSNVKTVWGEGSEFHDKPVFGSQAVTVGTSAHYGCGNC